MNIIVDREYDYNNIRDVHASCQQITDIIYTDYGHICS